MDECNFEGTIVLEGLARAGKLEEFMDAVDSGNLERVEAILIEAGIDEETIEIVLQKVADPYDDH
jgi:hypothetical protein